MWCAGMFPISGADFEALNAAVERLTLNDASVSVKRENSAALGAGFRCGSVPCLPEIGNSLSALYTSSFIHSQRLSSVNVSVASCTTLAGVASTTAAAIAQPAECVVPLVAAGANATPAQFRT